MSWTAGVIFRISSSINANVAAQAATRYPLSAMHRYNPAMATDPIAKEMVFRGVRFDVVRTAYPKRGGGNMQREVVVPHDAVVILAVIDNGTDEKGGTGVSPVMSHTGETPAPPSSNGPTVVLIRNERPAVGQTLWELPAGTMEEGEDAATCAARELTEETGYRADRIIPMSAFYSSPGFCTEKLHAFLARDLTHVGQHLDDTERIKVHPTPISEALAMIRDNRIQDAKTIAALLHYHTFVKSGV